MNQIKLSALLLSHCSNFLYTCPTFFAFLCLYLQMNDIVEASQTSTRELQEQIDIYKEKNRRELTELQRLLKERGQELEESVKTTKMLQGEVRWPAAASSDIMRM